MTSRPSAPKGRARASAEKPAVHPLLTFQFESDTSETKPRRRGPGSSSKKSDPTSIRDAITRWLDEQL